MGEEQRSARIWAGIHFRNSVEVSNAMGAGSPITWSGTT